MMLRKGVLRAVVALMLLVAFLGVMTWHDMSGAQGQSLEIQVNRTDDRPDVQPGDGQCDSDASSDGPQCTLRAAVMEANAILAQDPGATVIIRLPEGTFELTIPVDPDEENGNEPDAVGDLDILAGQGAEIRIEGAGPESTVVQGGDGFDDRIFEVNNGVRASSGQGGGVTAPWPFASRAYADVPAPARVVFRNLTIAGGKPTNQEMHAAGAEGGGMAIYRGEWQGGGDTVLERVVIRDNVAEYGAGIFLRGGITIRDSAIVGNRARDLGFPPAPGNPPCSRWIAGGGIYMSLDSGRPNVDTRLIERTLIAENQALYQCNEDEWEGYGWYGGALVSYATLVNVTISDNYSTGVVGGISINGVGLIHVTIAGNRAERETGGIDIGGFRTNVLFGTIVADNYAPEDPDCTFSGLEVWVSEGYNLLEQPGSCASGRYHDPPNQDTDILGEDALLLPLGDYGGPTQTRPPQAGSPAVDAIPIERCAASVTQDQRGKQRPSGQGCDIGAVELQPDDIPIAAPQNVRAFPGDGRVTLTWDPVAGAESYVVYASRSSGVNKESYESRYTGITATSYQVTGLENGVTYYFVVTAVRGDDESPESQEVSATPQAGLPRLVPVSPPTAVVVGLPFDLQVEARTPDDTGRADLDGQVRLRVSGARLRGADGSGAVTATMTDGLATFDDLVLESSPVGEVSFTLEAEGAEAATGSVKVALLLVTNSVEHKDIAIWPVAVPQPGQGDSSEAPKRFAHVRLLATTEVPSGCMVAAAGNPEGQAAPDVDDTVRIVPLLGGEAEDVTPDEPVQVLTSERNWAGLVLLSTRGTTYGSGDIYAVALDQCQVGLFAVPVLERDALPAVRPHITADTQEPVAAQRLNLQISLTPPTGESIRSASLEISVPASARLLGAQPAQGLSLMETCTPRLHEGSRRLCYAVNGAGDAPLAAETPILTLSLLPAEGLFQAYAAVTGAAGDRFWFPGEEVALQLTIQPGQRAIIDSVAQYYATRDQLEITLHGFNVEGVDRIVLSNGASQWEAGTVQAAPGVVSGTFSPPPEMGVYSLNLYRQGEQLQVEGESSIAVAPAVPYVKVDVGRCAQPIIPPRSLATDVVVRNEGTMDADVLLLVVTEPWAANPSIDLPGWSCVGGAEPVRPQVINSGELRGPQGERGFVVRLTVPAGGARTFLVRRSLSQEAVNEGEVTLGSRVVPVLVRIIGYAPAGTAAYGYCNASSPCPVVLDVLEKGWLSYVEALGYLEAMGREGGQAYLEALSRTAPSLAQALLVAHIGQVSAEMDAVVSEYLGHDVTVYGEGEAIINSVASNVVQGIRNFLQDNADLFKLQTYIDTLKFTVQGFVDGTNASYLTAAADAAIQAFTFGLVNPNWEPVYADAPYVEYARGVGTAAGVVYNYYAMGGALKVAGTALNQGGRLLFTSAWWTKVVGRPVLPAQIGNVWLALGYNAERGLYFTAQTLDFRLYIGALNQAPKAGSVWSRLLALDLTQRTPQGAAMALLRRCLLRGFDLERCLNTEVAQELSPEELAALRWQLQNAGVTGNDLTPLEEQLEEARRRFYEANDGWRVNLKGETDQMSVPALSSYDPNEIALTPTGPDGWVRSLDTLRATVRFENEGSGPAFDIRVDVPLPQDLDESSLVVEASSHLSYQVDPDVVDFLPDELHREGNEYIQAMQVSFDPTTRVLSFYFPNILLPPASCETAEGPDCNDGFVTFTIRPRRPLGQGEGISLYADIYFDLNPPVRTNTETRQVDAEGPTIALQGTVRPDGTAVITWDGQDPASGVQEVELALWRQGDLLAPISVLRLPAGQREANMPLPSPGRYTVVGYAIDRVGNAGSRAAVLLELSSEGGGPPGPPPELPPPSSPPPPPPGLPFIEVSVPSPTGTGELIFRASLMGGPLFLHVAPYTGTPPVLPPAGYELPHGLYSITVSGLTPGATVTIDVILPTPLPIGAVWLKLIGNSWVALPVGDDDGDNVITITLTDGGQGDADGVANGVIIDPGGPAIPLRVVALWGDVDCDGDVDAVDALKVLRHVVRLPVAVGESCPRMEGEVVVEGVLRAWGDVDGDGVVGAVDALKILRHVVRLRVDQVPGTPAIGREVEVSLPRG